MKVNIFRKINLFFTFRKNLLKAETDLKIQFNIRIDSILRFYTVLNVPNEVIEEPYNLRKSDIDTIGRNYVKEYNFQLSQFLNSRGLTELYDLYDMEKVDKYSYLLVFGFSIFNTKRLANNLIRIWIPIVSTILFIFIFYKIFS
jgi:hypothetical protein